MNNATLLSDYRDELRGWKISALRLTANGRFIGYAPEFLAWIERLSVVLSVEQTTNLARHEFAEVQRRISANNDDLFPDICDRLERTLILAEEVAYNISKADMEDFNKFCKEDEIEPNEKVIEFIRVFVRQRRRHQPDPS